MIDMLLQQLAAQPPMEWLAVFCSLAYVHFAAKQHLACWPFALASTGLYTWLFWETSLFFQSILNAWYLVMAVYGWYNWKNMERQEEQGVISWSPVKHVQVLLGLALVTFFSYELFTKVFAEEIILLDLGIAVFSAFVTWMLTQKVLENWLYWIVINALAAWLCLQQELLPTALLFIIYVFYAIKGYFSWRKDAELVLKPE